jgi:hypothetical protein
MKGWIYRRAVGLKEFGERLAHIRVFGTRPFLWASGPFIRLGSSIVARERGRGAFKFYI